MWSNLNYKEEIVRKLLHLTGLLFIAGYPYLDKEFLMYIAVACLVASTLIEVVRLKKYKWFPFKRIFELLARPVEKDRPSGYFYFFMGVVMVLSIFEVKIALLAIASSTVGDTFSSIIGRRIGRRRLLGRGGKTLEGSIAGALSIILLAPVFMEPLVLISMVSFFFAEFLNIPEIDDNLLHPIVIGTFLTIYNIFIS